MGLTPTGGVMMGTRSGDLDPGVLLHLLRTENYSVDELDQLVNHHAGLQGVSGKSSDMRQLLADTDNQEAALAVQMFCYSIAKFIGAMAAALNGVELLVFTAGIGEHAAEVRSRICSHLEYLGIVLDESANFRNADVISAADSRCIVRVIPTDEDLQIARHCLRIADIK
jgi:acetate kinase